MYRQYTAQNLDYQQGCQFLENSDEDQAINSLKKALSIVRVPNIREAINDNIAVAYVNKAVKLINSHSNVYLNEEQFSAIKYLMDEARNYSNNDSFNENSINKNMAIAYAKTNNFTEAVALDPTNISYGQQLAQSLKISNPLESKEKYEHILNFPISEEQEIQTLCHLADIKMQTQESLPISDLEKADQIIQSLSTKSLEIEQYELFVNKNLGFHYGYTANNHILAKKYLTVAQKLSTNLFSDITDTTITDCLSYVQNELDNPENSINLSGTSISDIHG